MTRERGECGVLGRSAKEDRGKEVEHRMAPWGCEEKTGEQEALRLRLGGDLRDQDRQEAREGGLRGEDQGRHVVHVKPGRQTREHTRKQSEHRHGEKARDQTEGRQRRESCPRAGKVSGARRPHSPATSDPWTPPPAARALGHAVVIATKCQAPITRKPAPTPIPAEALLARDTPC